MMKIRAKTLMCGEVEIQGEDRENILVLEAIGTDWSIGGGVHVVMPEAEYQALAERADVLDLDHDQDEEMAEAGE